MNPKVARQSTALPLPDLKYGLGIAFDAKKIGWPASAGKRAVSTAPRIAVSGGHVQSLPEAGRGRFGSRVRKIFGRLPPSADRVTAWHEAVASGAVVLVGEGAKGARVTVESVIGTADVANDTLIFAEKGSEVTIIEHAYSGPDAKKVFRSGRMFISADEESRVTHIRLQNLHLGVTERNRLTVEAKKGARVTCLEAVFGAAYAKSETDIALAGLGAETDVKTVFFGSAGNDFDLSVNVEHLASQTNSSINLHGALAGDCRAVARGLIRVGRGTLGCNGRQDLRGLLLSEKARMDALPKLEIDADDVRCGHGAAVGRLDKDSLFYLMSRGLDAELAKKMLVEGFFAKAIEAMRGSGLEQTASCIISERLDKAASHGSI